MVSNAVGTECVETPADLDEIGIAAIDIGAGGGPLDPFYPYHSNYDPYHWMVRRILPTTREILADFILQSKFGDPSFHTHKVMGQYLTLLVYHIASDPVSPLSPSGYVPELNTYLATLNDTLGSSSFDLDLSPLTSEITTFASAAEKFTALRDDAVAINNSNLLITQNHKALDFSRGCTSQGGLPTRDFYRHTIFAPGRDTGYVPVTFPGITESITIDKDEKLANE